MGGGCRRRRRGCLSVWHPRPGLLQVQIEVEVPDLPFSLVAGDAVAFLQLARQVLGAAVGDHKVVIRQLAPARLELAVELLPLALDLVFIHRCFSGMGWLGWSDSFSAAATPPGRLRFLLQAAQEFMHLQPCFLPVDAEAVLQHPRQVPGVAVRIRDIVRRAFSPATQPPVRNLRPRFADLVVVRTGSPLRCGGLLRGGHRARLSPSP